MYLLSILCNALCFFVPRHTQERVETWMARYPRAGPSISTSYNIFRLALQRCSVHLDYSRVSTAFILSIAPKFYSTPPFNWHLLSSLDGVLKARQFRSMDLENV